MQIRFGPRISSFPIPFYFSIEIFQKNNGLIFFCRIFFMLVKNSHFHGKVGSGIFDHIPHIFSIKGAKNYVFASNM